MNTILAALETFGSEVEPKSYLLTITLALLLVAGAGVLLSVIESAIHRRSERAAEKCSATSEQPRAAA